MPFLRRALLGLSLSLTVPLPASGQLSLEEAIAHLHYREIGPALMGGRIADLAVVEARPQTFYIGTGTGGVWRTDNHGTSWTPLFDDQPSSSIGDVTVDQSNPNVVWVGTGEPQNRQSSGWGDGVYKSTDRGESWTHMGLRETKHIGRILIHPRDPDIVWVAAVGNLWAPNPERGVYRTRDGGESWELVLHIDDDTGAIDLAMDPGDPNTIFAAMYQRRRTGFGFNGGGPGSGLYRTHDGGDSWVELTEGLPSGDKGRIGVDVFRGNGSLVYALVEADARRAGGGGGGGARQSGLYRSTDRGDSWEKVSDTNPRPMYYSQVRIDPSNPNRIYVLGTQLMVSDDGGRTFRSDGAVQIHVDHHALWVNPNDPDHLILGSDGGVSASWDGTAHWRMFDNLALGQFYAIGFDMRDPYFVCGGLQDNDPWCGPSNTRSFHGIRHQDWYETAYGDGFFTIVDPNDSSVVFSETQGGNMNRYDLNTGEKTPMRPITGPRAEGDTTKEYRFNWNSPLQFSPHDSRTIYLGANYLLRSRDRGMSWEEVGGLDLTKRIDRDSLEIMSVPGTTPMMSMHDGTSTYGNITSFAESPLEPGVLYVGTDDGNVQVSRDDGETWTNVADRLPGAPARTYVSRIEPSHHVPGRVYVTLDGHRNGDYAPYVFASEEYGRSWRSITNGLPSGWSVNVITEHHRAPDLLFIGNEIGVYVSVDRGGDWVRMKGNLPTVPVDDILVHPRDNDLLVGTHGRSMWIMADVSPLEHLSAELLERPGHLFPNARETVMWAQRGDWPFYGATYSAPNPPRATPIRYWVRDEIESAEGTAAEGVELTIHDPSGAVVRTLTGPGGPGIREVLWDWRHDPPYEESDTEGGGGFGGGAPPAGPVALPGRYTVRTTVGGESYETEIEIAADPRRPMAERDRRFRQDVLMSLHTLARPLHEARQALRRANDQIDRAAELVEDAADAPERLVQRLDELRERVEALEEELAEARRHAGVGGAIQGSSTRPTEDQLWQVDRAWTVTPGIAERIDALLHDDLTALNAEIYAPGLPPSPGERIVVPARPDRD